VGVYFNEGCVAHSTPERGAHVSTLAEFAQGLPVREDRVIAEELRQEILRRLSLLQQNQLPYHPTGQNCEVIANWLVGAKPESPQVFGWALALVVAGLFVASRKG
jgi:hypothetical protein